MWDIPWIPRPTYISIRDEVLDACSPTTYLFIQWNITPLMIGFLQYDPFASDIADRWHCYIELIAHPTVTQWIIFAPSLDTLLDKCPMLFFGVSEELLHQRVADDDVDALFVKKAYRT